MTMIRVNLVRKLLIFSLLICTPVANAVESKFAYSDFYKRLAVVKKEGLTRVSPAFYLLSANGQKPCEIDKAVIETADRQVNVTQTTSGELLVPYDAKLKQDKADLVLEVASKQDCAMSLKTKLLTPISSIDNVDALAKISYELEKLMLGQAGFWGKFFLPEFNGISLTLATHDQTVFTIANSELQVEQGHVYLSKQWLDEHKGSRVQLTESVVDIKPWLLQ